MNRGAVLRYGRGAPNGPPRIALSLTRCSLARAAFSGGSPLHSPSSSELTQTIVAKAKSLGATLAGVASVESLKRSPSHRLYPKIGMALDKHRQKAEVERRASDLTWPAAARSALVIAVAHDSGEPELDWWDGKGTPGNRILIGITRELSAWIERTLATGTHQLPYFVESGGIFLKDAAVMAGLGSVGKNNLVITPRYGPRIRFRALLLDREAEATGPLQYEPCTGCHQPCRAACPVEAFQTAVYSADAFGQRVLPGTDGTYDRATCNVKMEQDIDHAVAALGMTGRDGATVRRVIGEFEQGIRAIPDSGQQINYCVKYCRRCELACPLGDRPSPR